MDSGGLHVTLDKYSSLVKFCHKLPSSEYFLKTLIFLPYFYPLVFLNYLIFWIVLLFEIPIIIGVEYNSEIYFTEIY